MADKFKLANGDLTNYAFICGYVQTSVLYANTAITLYHDGGNVYHVRAHDHKRHERLFWLSFESLTEARKVYKSIVKLAAIGEQYAFSDGLIINMIEEHVTHIEGV